MLGEKWTVFWTEYSSDAYLYGSQITFHNKDDVEFVNELMPPGTIIKQWYSKTNFQTQKIEPALPIIDGETEYLITLNIDTEENIKIMRAIDFHPFVDPVTNKKYLYFTNNKDNNATFTMVCEMKDWDEPIYETMSVLTQNKYYDFLKKP